MWRDSSEARKATAVQLCPARGERPAGTGSLTFLDNRVEWDRRAVAASAKALSSGGGFRTMPDGLNCIEY